MTKPEKVVKPTLHRQVREELRRLIEEEFASGDRFPGEEELMGRFGVSQGTVRRALQELSDEGLLVRRVPAGTFVHKGGRRRPVALVLPRYTGFFISKWREVFTLACQARGLDGRHLMTQPGMDLGALVDEIERENIQACLLVANDGAHTAALAKSLARRAILVMSFEQEAAGAIHLSLDENRAMEAVLGHLRGLGHRRAAFVVNEPSVAGGIPRRVKAFRTVARALGFSKVAVIDSGLKHWEDSYRAAWDLMPRVAATGATSLVFASDHGAWAALKWFRKNGVAVPGQVSVVGFNDDGPNPFLDPALTSVGQPVADMVAAFLGGLTTNKQKGAQSFEPVLMVRESTGVVGN